jgi:hypothetical protein
LSHLRKAHSQNKRGKKLLGSVLRFPSSWSSRRPDVIVA